VTPPGLDEELIEYLERDQLVADRSRPLPRSSLTPATRIALWTLRWFVFAMGAMVIYTFAHDL
jgi:hypothetical protein